MILEALRRSREPAPGGASVPTLDTEHYPAVSIRSTPPWVWSLAGVTAASIGFVGFLWLGSGTDSAPKVAPSASAAADRGGSDRLNQRNVQAASDTRTGNASAVVQLPAAVPNSSPASGSLSLTSAAAELNEGATPPRTVDVSPSLPSSAAPSASVSALYASRSTASAVPVTVDDQQAMKRLMSEDNSAFSTARPSGNPPKTDVADTEVDVDEVLRRAQAAIGEERLTEYPAPLLESLSQQQKDRIPTVMYRQHDWASAGESSVVLNGQRLQVGGQHNGFRVKAILRDSVVLEWGGTTFRLRALNSWINL